MKSSAIVITTLLFVAAQPASAATTLCDAVCTDAARQRAVPVRVRMPQGASRAPVVLFSHGLGGTYAAGTDWAEAWATAGIATIHIQHPGSDENLWKSATGQQSRLAALRSGASGAQLIARVADVRFVLDEVARRSAEVMTDGCRIAAIDTALAAQPDVLEKIREGKVQAAGAVIGAVMKAMRGSADAARVRELVLERARA